MTTAIIKADAPISREQVELIKTTVAKGTSDDELKLFLYTANRTGLDPLLKQIYAVKRWNRSANREEMAIQVGIDGYRLIADRTGKYAGNDDAVFEQQAGNRFPDKATVTVWKLVGGVRCPFTATARWEQYYPGEKQGFMWGKMPHVMLAKCAEALALRKAFPNELSGVYTSEEMAQADVPLENACMDCGKSAGANVRCTDCATARKFAESAKSATMQLPALVPQHSGQTITELEATVATVVERPDGESKMRGEYAGAKTGAESQDSSDPLFPDQLQLIIETSTHWKSKFKNKDGTPQPDYYEVTGEDINGKKHKLICNAPKLYDVVHRLARNNNAVVRVQRTKKDGSPYKHPYITDVLRVNGINYHQGLPVVHSDQMVTDADMPF